MTPSLSSGTLVVLSTYGDLCRFLKGFLYYSLRFQMTDNVCLDCYSTCIFQEYVRTWSMATAATVDPDSGATPAIRDHFLNRRSVFKLGTWKECFLSNVGILQFCSTKMASFLTEWQEEDECESNPCQNKGSCIDLINDYKCNCTLGFTGTKWWLAYYAGPEPII